MLFRSEELGLPSAVVKDGILGSRTLDVLKVLAASGGGAQFSDRLADRRREWAKGGKNEAGWLRYIERFR